MRVRGLRPALREQFRPQEAHARAHERQALLLSRERLREELHTPEFAAEAHARPLQRRRGRRLVPPVALRLSTLRLLAGTRTRTGPVAARRGRGHPSDSDPNAAADTAAVTTALETRPQAQTRAQLEPRRAAAAQQQQRAAQLSGRLLSRLSQRPLGFDARPNESELGQLGLRIRRPIRRARRRQQGTQSRPDLRRAQQLVLPDAAATAAAERGAGGHSVDGSGGEECGHEPRAPEHGALAARRGRRLRVGGRRRAAVPLAGGPRRAAAAQELLSAGLHWTRALECRNGTKLCALLVFVCATGSHTLTVEPPVVT